MKGGKMENCVAIHMKSPTGGLQALAGHDLQKSVGVIQCGGGSRKTLLWPFNILKGLIRNMDRDFLLRLVVTGHRATILD